MLLVQAYLKDSAIHGMGCFAGQDIAAGAVVWRFDAGLDVVIAATALAELPPEIASFLRIYTYGQGEGTDKTYILCGDHARHMNHSDDPNVIEATDGSAINYAARAIFAGEELTCNYFAFDSDAEDKLGRRSPASMR